MRLFRPEAEVTGDYRSILHPADTEALERVARNEEQRDDLDA
jgi:hypothetical protein